MKTRLRVETAVPDEIDHSGDECVLKSSASFCI